MRGSLWQAKEGDAAGDRRQPRDNQHRRLNSEQVGKYAAHQRPPGITAVAPETIGSCPAKCKVNSGIHETLDKRAQNDKLRAFF